MKKIEIKKANYGRGIERVISVGLDYHIVIDPKHWEEIRKIESEQTFKFKDEQNQPWEVWLDEDKNFTFFHPKDRDLITVKSEKLI